VLTGEPPFNSPPAAVHKGGAVITNEILEISNEDWAACYGQP